MTEQSAVTMIQKWAMKNAFILALSAIGLIYLLNLFLDVMEIDAAQYAEISREMYRSGSYLEVYLRGQDYLDKPPLLFWLSSASFALFGVSSLAYKLPAVFTLVLGIYSLHQFTALWYDRRHARAATLIFASSQAAILMTNDVRTDILLTGFVSFSVWQLSAYIKSGSLLNILWGGVGVGLAMLSKGPIGLLLPTFAVGGHLLITGNWKVILRPHWLIAFAIAGITLIPMCIGLYHQFDMHPEKEVYGLHGPSGLEFFFWTQSFGRITGDIYWDNGAGYFYFLHTILWDFQPWIFLLIPALGMQFVSIFRNTGFRQPEYFSVSVFVIGFLALSASHYKLPHYIFPLLPFAAILSSNFLYRLEESASRALRILTGLQTFLAILFVLAAITLYIFCFSPGILTVAGSLALTIALGYLIFRTSGIRKVLGLGVITMLLFGWNAATCLYPSVLTYQSQSQAGEYISKISRPTQQVYAFAFNGYSLDFYADRIIPAIKEVNMAELPVGSLIFTDSLGMEAVKLYAPDFKVRRRFFHHNATSLTLPFLLKRSRKTTLSHAYLLEKTNHQNFMRDSIKEAR